MKPTLPMYLSQSLQGHLLRRALFLKKMSSDFAFLISQGTISHILGARKDMLSVPKYIVRFLRLCRVESFLRLHGFCTEWKISFIISGPKSFLAL